MRMSPRVRLHGLSFAVAAGVVVALAFALIVHSWGAKTLGWPAFRSLLVFVYPFTTVPIRTSLYGVFVLTAVLNGCYYGCLALLAIYMRTRVASAVVVAIAIVLVALVTGPVLHVAFQDFGAIHMQ
jgi:hypothetical protein